MAADAFELDRAVLAGQHDYVRLDDQLGWGIAERNDDFGSEIPAADIAEANGTGSGDALSRGGDAVGASRRFFIAGQQYAQAEANRHQDACRESHLPLPLPPHGL